MEGMRLDGLFDIARACGAHHARAALCCSSRGCTRNVAGVLLIPDETPARVSTYVNVYVYAEM